VWINRRKRSEFAIQVPRDQFAEEAAVVREADLRERQASAGERQRERFQLRALP